MPFRSYGRHRLTGHYIRKITVTLDHEFRKGWHLSFDVARFRVVTHNIKWPYPLEANLEEDANVLSKLQVGVCIHSAANPFLCFVRDHYPCILIAQIFFLQIGNCSDGS